MRLKRFIGWGVLGGLVLIVVLLFLLRPGPSLGEGERVNILILGLDEISGTNRNDVNILASIRGREVVLISLPRDLRLKFPDGEFHKLNAAYRLGGVRLARRVVSEFLDLPISFYVVVDYRGFAAIIDQLGGVEIEVEKPMKYDDEAQNLHIDIPAGLQVLDGEQALNYIRYRDASGDIGRIARQHKFIKALLAKGIQSRSLKELQALIRTASRYVTTDLSLLDMFTLAKRLHGLTEEDLRLARLPGEPVRLGGIDYLEPQIYETRNLIDDLILGLDVLIPAEVRVGVFNGSGVQGQARRTATYLAGRGFNVVYVGNADNFNYQTTYLIIMNDPRAAQLLLRHLPAEVAARVETLTVAEAEAEGKVRLDRLAAKGYNLEEVDLVMILGKGFEVGG